MTHPKAATQKRMKDLEARVKSLEAENAHLLIVQKYYLNKLGRILSVIEE